MNNPKLNVPSPGRRASDVDGDPITAPTGQTISNPIFHLIGEAEATDKTLTVWDLRKVLDLPLQEIFVGLRALEFERLVNRGTPSQDTLSTPLSLTDKGRELYFG
ncbi:MAG: hypothetical protein R3E14_14605 [Erythrobacter sp.]